jgi:succinoglycan biosynthesis transport protein ExoP
MKLGLSKPQDFLALLVRRRWWVIAPFIALSCATAVLTHFLPKSYVSETLILVRPRDVPNDFVKDLIAGTPEQRLKVIEQTVLSRTNLLQILREFSDDLPELASLNMDQKVVKLRSQIGIYFELDKRNGVEQPLSYFRISYRNQDPELAQKVATKLTTLFIEQDSQTRETQVFGTTEFLSSELAKVMDQMNESERKLKDFKLSRQFVLPDQREVNLRSLDRLAMDKQANGEALERLLTLRLNLERDLSETPTTVQRQVSTGSPDARLEVYLKAEDEYKQLSERYTPNMPDVKMAKAHLDRLKAELPPSALAALAEKAAAAATTAQSRAGSGVTSDPNPVYVRLQAQMAELSTELEIHQKEKAWIDSETAKYNGRIEEIPKVELDVADVQRQSEDLRKQYDELKNHLEQARLSESLESKQKGSQFVVVDPANYPLDPDKPDKTAVLLAGCCISLVVAIAFAAAVDIARQKVWTQSQIETLWGLPVLIEIPAIVTDADLAEARKKKFKILLASAASVLVYGFCLYGVYLKHNFILRQLDPLLQKYIYKQ